MENDITLRGRDATGRQPLLSNATDERVVEALKRLIAKAEAQPWRFEIAYARELRRYG